MNTIATFVPSVDNYATLIKSTSQDRRLATVTKSIESQCLQLLLREGKLTKEQYDWSSLIAVPDDSMGPVLLRGGVVVLYWLDPSQYSECLDNVVAFTSKESSETYLLGRLHSVSRRRIKLTRDHKAFSDLAINRQSIQHMFKVIFTVWSPVV